MYEELYMLVSNVAAYQTVKVEFNLLSLSNFQENLENDFSKLDDLIAEVELYADELFNDDDTDYCCDYKDVSRIREECLLQACMQLDLGVTVIADAYSCPRNPIYKFYLKNNRNIFKII